MQGLRALPSVDRLLSGVEGQALVARHGRAAVTDALRAALEDAREAVRRGGAAPDGAAIASRAAQALEEARPTRGAGRGCASSSRSLMRARISGRSIW